MTSQSSNDKRIDASATRPSPSGGAAGDNQARKQLFAKESMFLNGFFRDERDNTWFLRFSS